MRPSEVESPMCTTALQLVRVGARADTWGLLAAVRPVCWPAVDVRSGGGRAPAAGLADWDGTTPAMPQLASTTTGMDAATAIRTCRPTVPGCHPVNLI